MKISPAGEVRDLAWAGRHAEAIERATVLLETPRISVTLRLDLLELRTDSHVLRAEFDEAARDVEQMIEIARASKKPAHLAQALVRRGYVEMRRGASRAAVKTFTAALKAARESRVAFLEAMALVHLAEALSRARIRDSGAEQHAIRAAQIFERLGRTVEKGRAMRARAMVQSWKGNAEESLATAREAAAIAQQAGDQLGLGAALNLQSFHDVNLAESIRLLNQAHAAHQAAGSVIGGAIALNNLGISYARLGLFARAGRLLRESNGISERAKSAALANGKINLATVAVETGDARLAHTLTE